MSDIKISSAPLDNAQQIAEKIASLQIAMQQQAPGYERLLHVIHKNLALDPDLVHILTEEQIGVIVAGLQKKKGIVISAEKSKARVKKGGYSEGDI